MNRKIKKRVCVMDTLVGRGVFARRAFDARRVIGEIDGRVMPADVESDYIMDLDGKAGLDPVRPFRFLNHSCEPNCELLLWKYRRDRDDGVHRLWLQTTREISIGDELTIDYEWPAATSLRCLCGSALCRGWVA